MQQYGGGSAIPSVAFNFASFVPIAIGNFFRTNVSPRSPQRRQSQASKLTSNLSDIQIGSRSFNSFIPKALDLAAEAENWRHPSAPLPTFTGVWKKDRDVSDSMHEACELMALPWILRQALTVLNTLQLEENDETFTTIVKAGGLLDLVETYPWTGEQVRLPRRDKRRGKHSGRVLRLAEDQVCIEAKWEDPIGGFCVETFILSSDGSTLEQISDMKLDKTGEGCKYRTIYRRA